MKKKFWVALVLITGPLFGEQAEFLSAVFQGESARAISLWKKGGLTLGADERGVTALGLACQNGESELVAFLLEQGASPDEESVGEQPLLIASRTGSLACVSALLDKGAQVNVSGRGAQTPLMWAAAKGHSEVVSLLLEKGAKAEKTLESGFDALMFAVRAGRRGVVEVLLESGLDVEKAYSPKQSRGGKMRQGTSPLMLAVENGHLEMAMELVQRGANPNDLRSGVAPLHALTWVRKAVRGDGVDGIPPPFIVGEMGSLDFVRHLVKAGADVNLRLTKGSGGGGGRVQRKGQTPFFMAAASGDLPLAKVLLELGADPEVNNAEGTTPFLAAVGLGILAPGEEQSLEDEAIAMGRFLLELGADVNHVDQNGETAMHGAAYKASPKVMVFLDENGADIAIWNQENRYKWTPLLITQGFRPGNFRPIQYSEEAMATIMRSHGVVPPKSPPPPNPK